MKGVILAGGKGTRLMPCTKVTNKHLLPVYKKPMIYYPLEKLSNAGIEDILIISGPGHAGDFLELLNDGKRFGVNLNYAIQTAPKGIADALKKARDFSDGEKIAVILGDNIFEDNIGGYVENFKEQKKGAKIFLKEVKDPNRFGVAEVEKDKVINIEEKPDKPKSNLAVTGLYMFDNQVFDVIEGLTLSDRGEYEITDVNNFYINQGTTTFEILDGFWSDAGKFESLFQTTKYLYDKDH